MTCSRPRRVVDDERTEAPQASQETREAGWSILPPAAWSRIVALFSALALIKLALLIELRTQLQQAHWRVGAQPQSWLGFVAFGVALLVGVGTLALLSRQCQTVGVRAVRRVNAIVVGLGLCLIFPTFHEGDRNYLYPILTGVLQWTSLLWYFSMDLFFRPPYLAAWLVSYAACYYVMARLRREIHALTGACSHRFAAPAAPTLPELLIACVTQLEV